MLTRRVVVTACEPLEGERGAIVFPKESEMCPTCGQALPSVGTRIRRARKALGLTQVGLQLRGGPHHSTQSTIETGKQNLGGEALLLYVKVFDVGFDAFVLYVKGETPLDVFVGRVRERWASTEDQ